MRPTRGTSAGGPRAARVVVVLVWAVAAVLAGTVTSWAVTVIGGESGSTRSPVLSESEVAAALATQTSLPTNSPSPQATVTVTPTQVPAPTSAASPAGTPTPTAVPTHKPPAPTPTTPPAPLPAPAPAEVVRAWDVNGGRVEASCRDTQFSLLGATPKDGWSVSIKHVGADGAKIEFQQGETESKVAASCVGGVPVQTTYSGTDTTPGDD